MNAVAARVAGDSLKPRGVSPWLMQNGLFQAIVDSVSFCGARVDVRLCSATRYTGLIDPIIYFPRVCTRGFMLSPAYAGLAFCKKSPFPDIYS